MDENKDMVEIELDLDQKTIDYLVAHGKKNIESDDEKVLIDWAANDILKQMMDKYEKRPLTEVEEHYLIKKIKELEDGKSNS